jgi:hypothetical protein
LKTRLKISNHNIQQDKQIFIFYVSPWSDRISLLTEDRERISCDGEKWRMESGDIDTHDLRIT